MPHWNQEINHLASKEFANSPFRKLASLMLNSLYHSHPQQSPYGQGTVEKSSSVDIRTTSNLKLYIQLSFPLYRKKEEEKKNVTPNE